MKVTLSAAYEVFDRLLYAEGNSTFLAKFDLSEEDEVWVDCDNSTLELKQEHCIYPDLKPGKKMVVVRHDPERHNNPADPILFAQVATLKRTILTLRDAMKAREKAREELSRCKKAIYDGGFEVVASCEDAIALRQASDDDMFTAFRVKGRDDIDPGALSYSMGAERAGMIKKAFSGLSLSQLDKALELGRWFDKVQQKDLKSLSHVDLVEECLERHVMVLCARQASETLGGDFFGDKQFIVDLPLEERTLVEIVGSRFEHNKSFSPHQFRMVENSITGFLGSTFDLTGDEVTYDEGSVKDVPEKLAPISKPFLLPSMSKKEA